MKKSIVVCLNARFQDYFKSIESWSTLLGIIVSGLIVDSWSPVKMLQISSFCLIFTNILAPFFILNFNFLPMIMLQFFEYIFIGMMIPPIYKMISRWIPNIEKSTAIALCSGSMYLDSFVIDILKEFCFLGIKWNWIFYLSSIFILIWFVSWRLLIKDTPEECGKMDDREKVYLESFPELKFSKRVRFSSKKKLITYLDLFIIYKSFFSESIQCFTHQKHDHLSCFACFASLLYRK